MEEGSFLPRNHRSLELQNQWIKIQDSLKKGLIAEDDFSWNLPVNFDDSVAKKDQDSSQCGEILKYVGGVDLSFSKTDSSVACATLVVLETSSLQVMYEDSAVVELRVPYVPGFLAFREAPVLLELLEKMKKKELPYYPQKRELLGSYPLRNYLQLLMVDGNGLLHPRGFGLACHLGVLADLPTIGIGKNLHHVDGLTQSKLRQMLEAEEDSSRDIFSLIGASGTELGAAMRSTQGSIKPIVISVAHRISLTTAIKVVKFTCRFRVPEPIRQADIRSKDCLRNHGLR